MRNGAVFSQDCGHRPGLAATQAAAPEHEALAHASFISIL